MEYFVEYVIFVIIAILAAFLIYSTLDSKTNMSKLIIGFVFLLLLIIAGLFIVEYLLTDRYQKMAVNTITNTDCYILEENGYNSDIMLTEYVKKYIDHSIEPEKVLDPVCNTILNRE